MRRRIPVRPWTIGGALLLLAAACFQPAGREIEPTIVDIAILTPEPTVTPSATPFITPLPAEGYIPPTDTLPPLPTQTPEPTATAFQMFPEAAAPEMPAQLPTDTPAEAPLLLPTPTALPTDTPCQHTVQPGEWLSKIARMYNLTNQDFLNVNPWLRSNPNSLRPGDILVVPGCAPRVSSGAPALANPATLPTPIQLTERIYTVVKGDTLGAIARKFGVTVQQLRQANGLLEGDFIRVGQQLRIPAPR